MLLALLVRLGAGVGCTPDPRAPGTLRVNLGTEPPTLDWTRATDGVSIRVIDQIMRGLTRLGPDLRPEPDLARSWEIGAEGRVYTFHLRRDVRWTDGRPLEAGDFVYAWRRLLDPATAAEYAYFLFPVRGARAFNARETRDPASVGVRALDRYTLQVELEAPLVYFPSITTFMVTFPARRDVIERYGEAWTEPAAIQTLGPFRLVEWRHEYRIQLARNPDYYGTRPALERVIAYMVAEPSTALVLFEQHLLDIVSLPPLEIRRYEKRPEYRYTPALRGYYWGFNTHKPPFDDARVRRAFSMAIDRRAFPEVLRGGEVPQSSWIPPGMPDHNPRIGLRYDPARARALLAEAGVDPRRLPPIRVLYNSLPMNKLVGEVIQEQWRRNLGVRVELESREWKVFLKELQLDPPQVFRLGWGADYPDPDNFMQLFTSTSENNHTGFASARYDDRVERAARERDPATRKRLYDEAQRILCEEQAPIAPLFVQAINLAVSPRVRGFRPNPMDLWWLDGVSVE
ncbi:MAG: peptide ABC transporter substrate-binding protein [Myxococcota bacterium]